MIALMATFELIPYVGPSPILFGMTHSQVAELLGPPANTDTREDNSVHEHRNGSRVGYSESLRVREVSLWLPNIVLVLGNDLLTTTDFVEFLLKLDPQPRESLGFLIFNKIGVTVTGYAPVIEEDTRTVNVFAQGCWDKALEHSEPYRSETK
jgi:hypothetical protein